MSSPDISMNDHFTIISSTELSTTQETYVNGSYQTILRVIYAVIGCLGIFGNLIVCIVFVLRREVFNSVTKKLILNQSCIDCTNSIVFLLLRFAPRYQPENGLGKFLCLVWYNEYIMMSLFYRVHFKSCLFVIRKVLCYLSFG